MKIKLREFDRYCGECNTRELHHMFQIGSKEFLIECQSCAARRLGLGTQVLSEAGELPRAEA